MATLMRVGRPLASASCSAARISAASLTATPLQHEWQARQQQWLVNRPPIAAAALPARLASLHPQAALPRQFPSSSSALSLATPQPRTCRQTPLPEGGTERWARRRWAPGRPHGRLRMRVVNSRVLAHQHSPCPHKQAFPAPACPAANSWTPSQCSTASWSLTSHQPGVGQRRQAGLPPVAPVDAAVVEDQDGDRKAVAGVEGVRGAR